MPIVFAAISPHPPIIIPGVGSPADLKKVRKTVAAMEKLADAFRVAEVETLIVISPHSLIYPDRFNICAMEKLYGTLAAFGQPSIQMKYQNDLDIVQEIDEAAKKAGTDVLLYDNSEESFELDHGAMVPLYYFGRKLDSALKVVPIAYSFLGKAQHFSFGQIIRDICQKSPTRIGIVASGDLSHRLIQGAPAGYAKAGKEFDEKLIHLLQTKSIQDILYLDEDWVEQAGECGYRSILILLGALDDFDYKPEILSYEGPFGVGYAVVNFKLPQ